MVLCETLQDGETSVFLCEPETFIYFEMRVETLELFQKCESETCVANIFRYCHRRTIGHTRPAVIL